MKDPSKEELHPGFGFKMDGNRSIAVKVVAFLYFVFQGPLNGEAISVVLLSGRKSCHQGV
jgi:hypothetical protein